jgi:hypothetical protein
MHMTWEPKITLYWFFGLSTTGAIFFPYEWRQSIETKEKGKRNVGDRKLSRNNLPVNTVGYS